MDLTDRYLASIRRNLPKVEADDIVAELRDVLLTQRENKEGEVGRALTRQEEEALLKAFGHPLLVAARYGRRQHLIGPEVYPFYVYTLRLVLLIVGVALVTLAILGVMFSTGDPGRVVARSMGGLWTAGITTVGVITIIFALIERYASPQTLLQNWRPGDLPKADTKPQSRWNLVSEITAGAVFVLWWVGLIHFPTMIAGPEDARIDVEPAPIWAQLWWPILGIAAARMLVNVLALVRPSWLRTRLWLNLACGVVGLVVLAVIYRAGHWAEVSGAGVAAYTLAKVEWAIEVGVRVTLIIVAATWILQCLAEVRDVWKTRRASQ